VAIAGLFVCEDCLLPKREGLLNHDRPQSGKGSGKIQEVPSVCGRLACATSAATPDPRLFGVCGRLQHGLPTVTRSPLGPRRHPGVFTEVRDSRGTSTVCREFRPGVGADQDPRPEFNSSARFRVPRFAEGEAQLERDAELGTCRRQRAEVGPWVGGARGRTELRHTPPRQTARRARRPREGRYDLPHQRQSLRVDKSSCAPVCLLWGAVVLRTRRTLREPVGPSVDSL